MCASPSTAPLRQSHARPSRANASARRPNRGARRWNGPLPLPRRQPGQCLTSAASTKATAASHPAMESEARLPLRAHPASQAREAAHARASARVVRSSTARAAQGAGQAGRASSRMYWRPQITAPRPRPSMCAQIPPPPDLRTAVEPLVVGRVDRSRSRSVISVIARPPRPPCWPSPCAASWMGRAVHAACPTSGSPRRPGT